MVNLPTAIMMILLSTALLFALSTVIKHNNFVNKCNAAHGIVVKGGTNLICIEKNSIININ
jgi:hypothetical protein